MIKRADVSDLLPGDIIELHLPYAVTIRGALRRSSDVTGELWLGVTWRVRTGDGGCSLPSDWTLTFISRPTPPIYVNHHRTVPVVGDIVRNDDDPSDTRTWLRDVNQLGDLWWNPQKSRSNVRKDLPTNLRLLVDGETGQVVP